MQTHASDSQTWSLIPTLAYPLQKRRTTKPTIKQKQAVWNLTRRYFEQFFCRARQLLQSRSAFHHLGMGQNETTTKPQVLVLGSFARVALWVHIFDPQPFVWQLPRSCLVSGDLRAVLCVCSCFVQPSGGLCVCVWLCYRFFFER